MVPGLPPPVPLRLYESPEPRSRSLRALLRKRAMLDEIRDRIENEIEKLTRELNVELPKVIEEAVALGDLRENAEYKSALERQQFVQARLNHLTRRMGELSQIDVKAMPVDRVGFGSKIKVEDLHQGEEVTFTIVAGEFMDLEAGHISLGSPLGRGLMGAKEGETVTIQLPVGEREFRILELTTLPRQVGLAEEASGD